MTNDIIEIAKLAGFKVFEFRGMQYIQCPDHDDYSLLDQLTKFAELIQARAWISVEDKLPEDGEQVWINHTYGQGYAIYTEGDWFWELKDEGDLYSRQQAIKDGLEVAEIFHWMPMPTPPAAAQKGSV